jgi:hypothetical protein
MDTAYEKGKEQGFLGGIITSLIIFGVSKLFFRNRNNPNITVKEFKEGFYYTLFI